MCQKCVKTGAKKGAKSVSKQEPKKRNAPNNSGRYNTRPFPAAVQGMLHTTMSRLVPAAVQGWFPQSADPKHAKRCKGAAHENEENACTVMSVAALL